MAQGAERLRADGGVDWEGFDWFFMGGYQNPSFYGPFIMIGIINNAISIQWEYHGII